MEFKPCLYIIMEKDCSCMLLTEYRDHKPMKEIKKDYIIIIIFIVCYYTSYYHTSSMSNRLIIYNFFKYLSSSYSYIYIYFKKWFHLVHATNHMFRPENIAFKWKSLKNKSLNKKETQILNNILNNISMISANEFNFS